MLVEKLKYPDILFNWLVTPDANMLH